MLKKVNTFFKLNSEALPSSYQASTPSPDTSCLNKARQKHHGLGEYPFATPYTKKPFRDFFDA